MGRAINLNVEYRHINLSFEHFQNKICIIIEWILNPQHECMKLFYTYKETLNLSELKYLPDKKPVINIYFRLFFEDYEDIETN